MKTSHNFIWLLVLLFIVATVGTVSYAQNQKTKTADDVNEKLKELVLALQKRGDNDTIAKVSELLHQANLTREAAQVGLDVKVLEYLRSGQTNEALRLLESRLDGALASFGHSADPEVLERYVRILQNAKAYRMKYPHKSAEPIIDAAIQRAFESLPKK